MNEVPSEVVREVEESLEQEAVAWIKAAEEEMRKEGESNGIGLGNRPEPPRVKRLHFT